MRYGWGTKGQQDAMAQVGVYTCGMYTDRRMCTLCVWAETGDLWLWVDWGQVGDSKEPVQLFPYPQLHLYPGTPSAGIFTTP